VPIVPAANLAAQVRNSSTYGNIRPGLPPDFLRRFLDPAVLYLIFFQCISVGHPRGCVAKTEFSQSYPFWCDAPAFSGTNRVRICLQVGKKEGTLVGGATGTIAKGAGFWREERAGPWTV
jgi:hypothetical protein